jgi:hypothetical protein
MNDFVDTLRESLERKASKHRQDVQFRIIVVLFGLVMLLNLLGRIGVI